MPTSCTITFFLLHGNWSYSIFGEDAGTDNQTGPDANDRYATGRWRVPNKDNDNWKFESDLPLATSSWMRCLKNSDYQALDGSENTIIGDLATVKHYIGEIYFFRACEYFKRYQKYGDMPIITDPMPDEMEVLREFEQAHAPYRSGTLYLK